MELKLQSKLTSRVPSESTIKLIDTILSDEESWFYGYTVSKQSKVSLSTVYRFIDKLDDEGLLKQKWARDDDSLEKKRGVDRHLFKVTDEGLEILKAARKLYEANQSIKDIKEGRFKGGLSPI